jgi:hypothetical protein
MDMLLPGMSLSIPLPALNPTKLQTRGYRDLLSTWRRLSNFPPCYPGSRLDVCVVSQRAYHGQLQVPQNYHKGDKIYIFGLLFHIENLIPGEI